MMTLRVSTQEQLSDEEYSTFDQLWNNVFVSHFLSRSVLKQQFDVVLRVVLKKEIFPFRYKCVFGFQSKRKVCILLKISLHLPLNKSSDYPSSAGERNSFEH